MNQQGFIRLAIFAIAAVTSSFLILGFSRLVVSFRTAQTIAAPVGFVGFFLLIYLFGRATLSAIGVWPIEDDER